MIDLITGHGREAKGYAAWRPRGTDDWLLIYTLGGRGRFGYTGGELVTEVGDMAVLRPAIPHDYGVEPTHERWELLWTHFQPRAHWHEWLDWPERAPGLLHLTLNDLGLRARIVERFWQAHHLARGALRRRETFAMNALEEVLLWCDEQNPRAEQSRLDTRIRKAMDHLCHNLHEKNTLAELADQAGMSASRFAHLFREQVGMPPGQFLERQRLGRATQLLEHTPRTIQAIAFEVGFDNPFYFTQRFKRHNGLSPRDYRRRATGP